MFKPVRRNIPSMFHRRLLLLLAVIVLFSCALLVQLANLTVVQGARLRDEAEAALSEVTLIPTVRGRILDRKGRVLAMDLPSDDVAVDYRVITGEWAYQRAREQAYAANRGWWSEMGFDERERLIAQEQKTFDAQIERLWKALCHIGQIDRTEMEQRKAAIVERVQQIAASVSLRHHERRMTLFEEPLPFSLTDVEEQRAFHSVLTALSPESIARVRQLMAEGASDPESEVWRRVSVEPSKTRVYPLETLTVKVKRDRMPTPARFDEPLTLTVEGVCSHVIGMMRPIWRRDMDERPFKGLANPEGKADLGGYLPGDRRGAWGVEKSLEDRLRGLRGQLRRRLDTRTEEAIPPQPGSDVTLTIDVSLQARVQALMDERAGLMKVQTWNSRDPSANPLLPQIGDRLNGAAVVLDVASGEVLAAVSMPGMSHRVLRDEPESLLGDRINRPYINRAVGQAFQPGSTVKPLVLAAAITDRKVGYDEAIECEGHLLPTSKTKYRCWIYKQYSRTHGPLQAPEAIARSCNIYFFTLGRRLGAQQMVAWYDHFGLGRISGCGLTEETSGDLPKPANTTNTRARGFTVDDAINMGIGQGPVRWTPLQAAAAYAALANGGEYITPAFIRDPQDTRRKTEKLGLDPRGIEIAMQGLDQAVNTRTGTAHHLGLVENEVIFTIPGVKVYGKSGTAAAAPLRIDSNNDGRITASDQIVREGDHAWVVVIVKNTNSDRPQYVITLVVEHAGMGSAVAGPIVNQIIYALREEGYL